jgi:hypothetical protein
LKKDKEVYDGHEEDTVPPGDPNPDSPIRVSREIYIFNPNLSGKLFDEYSDPPTNPDSQVFTSPEAYNDWRSTLGPEDQFSLTPVNPDSQWGQTDLGITGDPGITAYVREPSSGNDYYNHYIVKEEGVAEQEDKELDEYDSSTWGLR